MTCPRWPPFGGASAQASAERNGATWTKRTRPAPAPQDGVRPHSRLKRRHRDLILSAFARLDRGEASDDTFPMRQPRLAGLVALLLVAGCAGPTAPPTWTRNPAEDPWPSSGLTPNADSIRYALYEDVYELDNESCPFLLATCSDSNDSADKAIFRVEDVSCRAVAKHEERCRFSLTERLPGRAPVRSRCTAFFETVGTSHDPMRWGVDYDDYDNPRMKCRR